MGGFGWHNPWPFEWGGGPTEDEAIYLAMRNAVGEGGSAKDENGIDGLWRACRATAIATACCAEERAILQAFPNIATDLLPTYEALLRTEPPTGATEVERRELVAAEWTALVEVDIPSLLDVLSRIDPRVALVIPAEESTTVYGKAFEPQDGLPSYGVRKATGFPAYSTHDIITFVLLRTGDYAPTQDELDVVRRMRRYLHKVLPSWVDFQVALDSEFRADISPLDLSLAT